MINALVRLARLGRWAARLHLIRYFAGHLGRPLPGATGIGIAARAAEPTCKFGGCCSGNAVPVLLRALWQALGFFSRGCPVTVQPAAVWVLAAATRGTGRRMAAGKKVVTSRQRAATTPIDCMRRLAWSKHSLATCTTLLQVSCRCVILSHPHHKLPGQQCRPCEVQWFGWDHVRHNELQQQSDLPVDVARCKSRGASSRRPPQQAHWCKGGVVLPRAPLPDPLLPPARRHCPAACLGAPLPWRAFALLRRRNSGNPT